MQAIESPEIIPQIGFGTYGRVGREGADAILYALETGYRHLDTAQSYGTEDAVGEALKRSGLPRGDVFLTTKIATGNLGAGAVLPSLRKSLDALGIEQVDLALIHWPAPRNSIPLEVYMWQLDEAQRSGLTRLIGVSNFTIDLLKRSENLLGKGRLVTNQVELNPLFLNMKLADFCLQSNIRVTCYQPIAQGRLRGNAVLEAMAGKHSATVEQIALAYEFAKGFAAIPTSSRRDRIRSNFAAARIALDEEDIQAIEALPQAHRSIDPEWGPAWD